MGEAVSSLVLLALDAASEACSAAVLEGELVRASRCEPLKRGHAERLMPMVEAVMAEAGFGYDRLGAVAATVGPGSFTGVRVGLAAARGIALAAGLPLVGVTTLEALAAAVPPVERAGYRILAALDALRGQIYAQWFDAAGLPLTPPMAATAAEAVAALDPTATLVVGSGADVILEALGPERHDVKRARAADWPDAATVGRLVWSRARLAGGIDRLAAASSVQPLYLRGAGAERMAGAVGPAETR